MKTLILLITIIAATSLLRAGENDEILWETEQIGGINDVLVSPLGDIFYNVTGSTIQIRSIEDGTLIDFFIPEDMPNHITHISITDDGRYVAMSGDNPHIIIYDLQEEREVKRFTTNVFERVQNGKLRIYNTKRWLSSSISPDGTKVTGIAEGDQPTSSQCWVVIDLETEEELIKDTRLGYDTFNPQKLDISEWISSEFTPDGNYIVSQINWGGNGKREPDSIYIHDANTFEVYDVVNNYYSKSNLFFNLSNSSSEFTYYNHIIDKISIFKIDAKESIETNIKPSIWSFTFLRSSDFIIYAYDSESQLYDYINDKILHKFETFGTGWATTLDDKLLISSYYNKILGINTYISKTSIENNYDKEITISPNPTDDFLNIDTELTIDEIEVLNIDGKLMFTTDEKLIDISQLSSGIYYLIIKSGKQIVTKQFNVVR